MQTEQKIETGNSRRCRLSALGAVLDAFYRIGLLAALVWLGFGLQSIAAAIDSNTDTCSVEPDTGDSAQQDEQPGAVKPLMSHML